MRFFILKLWKASNLTLTKTLHEKWSFLLRIFIVNTNTLAGIFIFCVVRVYFCNTFELKYRSTGKSVWQLPGYLTLIINSLQPGVAFPYSLKTSENLKVYRKATLSCKGLISLAGLISTKKLIFWIQNCISWLTWISSRNFFTWNTISIEKR